MPLPGGASDKAGNSYERRWTVFAMLDLLDGRAQALRIEVPGDEGAGSEFRLSVAGTPEWHQAKRQRAAGPWTVNALDTEGVVGPWRANLGRGERCVFVSATGADGLRELADRAVAASSWDEFNGQFLAAEAVRKRFDRLQKAWDDPPDPEVWTALQHVQVRAIGELELAEWINHRLRGLVTGAGPATAAAVLAQLADDSVHQELSAGDVWSYLERHGIAPRQLDRDASVVRRVAKSPEAFLAQLRPLYIGGEELARSESADALAQLDGGRRTILAGGAGAGKSVVTGQVVKAASERYWPVFVVAADRLPDVATTTQLGAELGLPDSPATVLAGVAAGGDALLVVDQLDSVGVASGRHPERLRLIEDLLSEARSYPGMRVLLACREFDLDHDRALRALAHDDNAAVVSVGDLDVTQIHRALSDAGLPAVTTTPLMRLLAVPLHLALYVELAHAGVDVTSARTLTDLYDRYWKTKKAACRLTRGGADDWLPVVERLVRLMNDRQELTLPEAVLDDLDEQAKVMASEGVLAVGQNRVAFFHETFFDYCFARQFIASGDTVRDWLSASEQDLFQRAQVRQILTYERGADRNRYIADLAWLLTSPDVRPHLKALVAALLETLADPTPEEWEVLRPTADDSQSPLHPRVWQAVRRNPAWFPVLDDTGTWEGLLRNGGDLADRAIWALTGHAADHAARVCELLASAPSSIWPSRRRGFLQVADVHRARELVDLLLDAVDDADYGAQDGDLHHILGQLAASNPAWGAEVLAALVRHALTRAESANPFHPDARLYGNGGLASETRGLADGAPREFVDLVLPLVLEVIEANLQPDWSSSGLVADALWSHRFYGADSLLRDNLYEAMGVALAALAHSDPAHATTVFETLRGQPHESAAFLLARGLAGNPAAFADAAADWLAATPGARMLGYTDSAAWMSRQLVAAISPHCSPAGLDQLVAALLYYAPPAERTIAGLRARGRTELCLLNGIASDRRPDAVERRLAELRRKFGHDDVAPPRGVIADTVPPPIPEDRARRMTDRHWLGAMRRYAGSDTSWRDGKFIGDASTQAQVLETLTKEDPQRFARLLLVVPADTAETYVSAILRGLAGARLEHGLLTDVCMGVVDFGGSDANRWLVRLIETHAAGTIDDQLVETVASIAVDDADPPERAPGQQWNGGSIDFAALNSTRGAATLALSQLIAEEPARLATAEPALRRLVVDPQPEVRAAAAAGLTPLLLTSPKLALELFHDAMDDAPGDLLGSHYVRHFLHIAVRQRRYQDVSATLRLMLTDPNGEARATAAQQLTVASFDAPELDNQVDAVLDGDDIARAAAVDVFATNITNKSRRDRSVAVLSKALHDPSKAVRDAAQRAFFRLADERLDGYIPLIAAVAHGPSLAARPALLALEKSRQPLPAAALDVCEKFVRVHQRDISDIATAAAGDAIYVVKLALRLHAQYTDPDLRRRCLDMIDQLVILGAHNIERDLDTIER